MHLEEISQQAKFLLNAGQEELAAERVEVVLRRQKGSLTLRNPKNQQNKPRSHLDWHSFPSLASESRFDRCETCLTFLLLGKAVPLMSWNTWLLHHMLPCQAPNTHMFHGDHHCIVIRVETPSPARVVRKIWAVATGFVYDGEQANEGTL